MAEVTASEPEQWRPVVGYEGFYEVSDRGRVRSLDRLVSHGPNHSKRRSGALLSPMGNSGRGGYLQVRLQRNGVGSTRKVHQLVLESFVGPKPDGFYGCHNDGNPLNNRLTNLRWDTPSSNSYDKVRHGNHHATKKTHCPYGHPLTDPNLLPKRLPMRICKACGYARNQAVKAIKRGEPRPDHQEASDANLAAFLLAAQDPIEEEMSA